MSRLARLLHRGFVGHRQSGGGADVIKEYIAEEFFNKSVRLADVKEFFQRQELKRKRCLGFQLEIVFLFFFVPFCVMWQSYYGQTTNALDTIVFAKFPARPFEPTVDSILTGQGSKEVPDAPELSTFAEGFSKEDEYWQWVNNVVFGEIFLKGVCGVRVGDGGGLPFSKPATRATPALTAGLLRIRQVRVSSDVCPASASKMNITCYPEYSNDNEDTRPIAARLNSNVTAYLYQTPASTTEENYWGEYAVYPGGGYTINLTTGLPPGEVCNSNNLTVSLRNQINQLRRARLVPFIDQATRALILTFTTFSPDTGAVTTTKLVTEISFSGSFQNSIQNVGAIFYRSNISQSTMQIVTVFLGVIECIFIISSLWGLIFGWKIESSVWCVTDLATSALMAYQMYVVFSLFFVQSFQQEFAASINAQDPTFSGSGFYSGAALSTMAGLNSVNSCILLISCFRIFRYSQYFDFMDTIHKTLKRTWSDIILYFSLLVLLSLGYVLCGMVVLSGSLPSYRTYAHAIYTLMQYFILSIDYYSISDMKPFGIYFAPIFLVSFIFIFTWYMVAVFIAVVYVGYRVERTIMQRKLLRKREWEKRAVEHGAKPGWGVDLRLSITNDSDKQQDLVVLKRSFHYSWQNLKENSIEFMRSLVGLQHRDGFKELLEIVENLEKYEQKLAADLATPPSKLFFVSFFELIDIVRGKNLTDDEDEDHQSGGGGVRDGSFSSTTTKSVQRATTRRYDDVQLSAEELRGDDYLDRMHPVEIQVSRVFRLLWVVPDNMVDEFSKFEHDDVTQKIKRSLLVRIQESMQTLEQREAETARVIWSKLHSLQTLQQAMERDMRALRDLMK